jgi:biopolymer transport protein ExbD
MPAYPLRTLLSALCLPLLVAACHVPAPVSRVVLHIAADGQCLLQDQAVPLPTLARVLTARRTAGAELELEVRASPQADMKWVQAAVAAARQAGVRVSFAREDGTP